MIRTAALVLAACCAAQVQAKSDPKPAAQAVRAELSVRWGPGAGSDAFRTELARAAASRLGTSCFAEVVMAGSAGQGNPADVLLEVVLSEAIEEVLYDDSIATALNPEQPTQELRRVARFEMSVDALLTARASGKEIASKSFKSYAQRRPIYIGEDPQETARADAIDDAVRTLARGLGCGGKKLERKIREALAAPPPEPSGAR